MNVRIIVVSCLVALAYGQLSGNSSNSSDFSELPKFNENVGQNVSAFGFSEERPRAGKPPGRRPVGSDDRRPDRKEGRRPDRQDGRRPDGVLSSEQRRVVRQEPVLVTGADLLAFFAFSNAPLLSSNPTPPWPTLGDLRQPPPTGGQRLQPPPPPPPQGDQRQPPPQTGGQRFPPPQGDQRQPPPVGQRQPPPPCG